MPFHEGESSRESISGELGRLRRTRQPGNRSNETATQQNVSKALVKNLIKVGLCIVIINSRLEVVVSRRQRQSYSRDWPNNRSIIMMNRHAALAVLGC